MSAPPALFVQQVIWQRHPRGKQRVTKIETSLKRKTQTSRIMSLCLFKVQLDACKQNWIACCLISLTSHLILVNSGKFLSATTPARYVLKWVVVHTDSTALVHMLTFILTGTSLTISNAHNQLWQLLLTTSRMVLYLPWHLTLTVLFCTA